MMYPRVFSAKCPVIYSTFPPNFKRRDTNSRPYHKLFINPTNFKGNQSFDSSTIKSIRIKLTKKTILNSFNIIQNNDDLDEDGAIKFDYELIGSDNDFKSKVKIEHTGDELKFKLKSTKSDTLLNLNIKIPSCFKALDLLELKVKAKRSIPGSIYFNLSTNFNLKILELKHINSEVFFNKFNLTNSKIELNSGNISFNETIMENLNIKNELGIIKFNLAKLNKFELIGKSAKVEGSLLKSKEVLIMNEKGTIDLTLIDNPSNRNMNLRSKYGDIQLSLNKHYSGWFEINSKKGKAEIEEKSCCLNDIHLINNSTAAILGYKGFLGVLDSKCKINSKYGNSKLIF
ncbi:hypothetical protein CONCODRAFT_5894 [Conidiobolus coronatus NRRL 28638]|uniref:DUF4097 domain-containing protein n=1 Tax=Conidiobolus coronatus (strain ATCC 28846 / CBS 209.66 / NRRL 28638) TaxID=796925 RepID=A0A137P8N2_CONC2|nr:hypothetical protein CONCODRAFT_5894 [Conidiobolus coronatus NRRL 28638]|eukprot:KXN71360.1 hypothetical protein CONCODRAFT_5894 [Conidiobolus coronatus NRRL 28638]